MRGGAGNPQQLDDPRVRDEGDLFCTSFIFSCRYLLYSTKQFRNCIAIDDTVDLLETRSHRSCIILPYYSVVQEEANAKLVAAVLSAPEKEQ